MNIGNLKHRVSILDYAEMTSPNGFKSKEWIEVGKAWAKIENEKRSSMEENEKKSIEESLTFTIRYRALDEKSRLLFQGIQYEILSIEDKTFEKRFLTIMAKVVK